jgi:hypothetical protein
LDLDCGTPRDRNPCTEVLELFDDLDNGKGVVDCVALPVAAG